MCFAFGFEGVKEAGKHPCLDSSAVEHAAVNRGVVGSSPTRGVEKAYSLAVGLFSYHKDP